MMLYLFLSLLLGSDPEFADPEYTRRFRQVVNANRHTANAELTAAITRQPESVAPPLLPRALIATRPSLASIAVSKNHRGLAYLVRERFGASLWVMDMATGQKQKLLRAEIEALLGWSADGAYLFLQTPNTLTLVPLDGSPSRYISRLDSAAGDRFYGVDPDRPHHVFIGGSEDDLFFMKRLDKSGQSEELYRGTTALEDFLTGDDGALLFAKWAVEDRQVLFHRSGSGFRKLASFDFLDDAELLRWDARSSRLWMRARYDDNMIRLITVTLPSMEGELAEVRAVFRDPEHKTDLEHVFFDAEGQPFLLRYAVQDRSGYKALNPETQSHVRRIENQFPADLVHIRPGPVGRPWLIRRHGSRMMISQFYLYDPQNKKFNPILEELDDTAKQFLPEFLSPKIPFSYRSADGFLLHAFVTLPLGISLAEAGVVVAPHGGPFARTGANRNPTTQLLANRGYIVIEPNFRGSTGYGLDYITASHLEFGDGRVQNDIIDSVYYILSLGIGNSKNMAIVGHSFGGFSALAALAFTPDLFQMGVAAAAPIDLVTAVQFWPEDQDLGNGVTRDHALRGFLVDLNDPQDIQRMERISPVVKLDQIQKPLLIIAGKKDSRVNILDVRSYTLALMRKQRPLSFFVAEDQGHSFDGFVPRRAYAYLIEKMLADHLGGRLEPLKDPKLKRYLRKQFPFDVLRLKPERPSQ